MTTAAAVLLACGLLDLLACGGLLAVVYVEHRRSRRHGGATAPPSARLDFAVLAGGLLAGLVAVYAAGWLLFIR